MNAAGEAPAAQHGAGQPAALEAGRRGDGDGDARPLGPLEDGGPRLHLLGHERARAGRCRPLPRSSQLTGPPASGSTQEV